MNKVRIVMLGLILWLVSCCQSGPLPAQSPQTIGLVADISSQTVALVGIAEDREEGDPLHKVRCAGVWVGHSAILTASHCVQDKHDNLVARVMYVAESENRGAEHEPANVHIAWVDRYDPKHDLALLHAEGITPLHQVAGLAAEAPLQGSDLYIIGHTKGLYWSYQHGWVSQYQNFPGPEYNPPGPDCEIQRFLGKECGERMQGPWLQVSAPIYYGNSGGGAWNANGELVGIASFLMHAPNTGFFVHVDTIRTFLQGTP